VKAVLQTPAFVARFGEAHGHDALKRVPPGYPADHELAEMFRWKDVVFGRSLSDSEALSADLPEQLADDYAAAVPVFRFLQSL
jgi:hypothetical protein